MYVNVTSSDVRSLFFPGRIALTLGYCKPTNFTYKITFADTGDEMYQGQKLKNFALQHHGQNQTGTFVFRAPRQGQYYFTIFAQLLTGELGVKNIFTASCEYKVSFQQFVIFCAVSSMDVLMSEVLLVSNWLVT